MTRYGVKIVLLVAMCFFTVGCANNPVEEVVCNFDSGANNTKHDKTRSLGDNLSNDVAVGVINVLIQSAHRAVSVNSYSPCVSSKKK